MSRIGKQFASSLIGLLVAVLVGHVAVPAQNLSGNEPMAMDPDFRFYDDPVDPELYLVRPGERLLVRFLKATAPSLGLVVNPEGKVVQEGLGIIDAKGTTLAELRAVLRPRLMSLYNVQDVNISLREPYRVAITVRGAVDSPGVYVAYTSQRVSEVIEKAGGIADGGSSRSIRFESARRSLPVDMDRVHFLGDHSMDPYLYAGDRIVVPEQSVERVFVVGQVRQPREIELLPGDDAALLLALAGGVRHSGDSSAVQISGETERSFSAGLRPGDVLVVPRLTQGDAAGQVVLTGEVKRPGRYAIDVGARLASVVAGAGGLTGMANVRRVTVFREDEVGGLGNARPVVYPISVAVAYGEAWRQFELRPEDSIVVPPLMGFVTVEGEVHRPAVVPYTAGRPAGHYIDLCGGYTSAADRGRLYIQDRISQVSHLVSPDVSVFDGDVITIRRDERL